MKARPDGTVARAARRGRELRAGQGAPRHLAGGRGRCDRGRARRERRGQDDHAALDLEHGAAERRDPLRRALARPHLRREHRRPGHRARTGGPRPVPRADDPREPPPRRVHPTRLLLDEPSLGLAPIIVSEIFRIVKELNREGMTVLVVEQNAHIALQVASSAYVLEVGTVALHGPSAELERDESVRRSYLGY